jgi:hypothetical protein
MSGQRFGLPIAAVLRRGYHPTNPILSASVCPGLPAFLLSLPVSEDNVLRLDGNIQLMIKMQIG